MSDTATTIDPAKPQSLTIPGVGEIILVPAEAYGRRDEVIEKAQAVRAVFDVASRDAAIAARNELKEARVQLGKFRDFAKAPVIALGKKIESVMAEFSKQVGCGTGGDCKGPEEIRIDALLVRYENEQRQLREAEEKKRLAKLEEDRQAELERQREIIRREEESKRKLQEAADALAKAERARSDAGKDKALETATAAQAEAERLAEEAEKLAIQAEQDELERKQREREEQAAVVPAAPTPGYKPKEVWTFEVTNVLALAMHDPELVKIEPRKDRINEAIANGKFDFSPKPGELVGPEWEDSKVKDGIYRTAPGLRIFKRLTT